MRGRARDRRYIGEQYNEHGSEHRKTHLHSEAEGALVGKAEGLVPDASGQERLVLRYRAGSMLGRAADAA